MKTTGLIKQYNYKGYTIFISDCANGYYGTVEREGVHVDCTPYRNDVPSIEEASENIVDEAIMAQ